MKSPGSLLEVKVHLLQIMLFISLKMENYLSSAKETLQMSRFCIRQDAQCDTLLATPTAYPSCTAL